MKGYIHLIPAMDDDKFQPYQLSIATKVVSKRLSDSPPCRGFQSILYGCNISSGGNM